MKFSLPPHIAWPLFVLALLLLGITTTFGVFLAARSDGGAQVIDDYYRKAVAWDSLASGRLASKALGWQVDLHVERSDSPTHRFLHFRFSDQQGVPLTDLKGTVRLFRPQLAHPIAEETLTATATPGSYRLLVPINQPGLWDIEVDVMHPDGHYQHRMRREVLH